MQRRDFLTALAIGATLPLAVMDRVTGLYSAVKG